MEQHKSRMFCYNFKESRDWKISKLSKSYNRILIESGIKCFRCNEDILMEQESCKLVPCMCK